MRHLSGSLNISKIDLLDNSFWPDLSMVRGYKSPIPYNKIDHPEQISTSNVTFVTHYCILDVLSKFEKHVNQNIYGLAWESCDIPVMKSLYRFLYDYHKVLKTVFRNIFTYHPDLIKLDPDFFIQVPAYCSWINTEYGGHYTGQSKDGLISSVVSEKLYTPLHHIRHKLNHHCNDLIQGKFGNFWDNPVKYSVDAIAPYKFHLVIENSDTDNYFTEKLLNCFACKTVPIYIGCRNIREFFNPNGMIILQPPYDDFREYYEVIKNLGGETYHSMTPFVQENFTRVQKYLCPLEDFILPRIKD